MLRDHVTWKFKSLEINTITTSISLSAIAAFRDVIRKSLKKPQGLEFQMKQGNNLVKQQCEQLEPSGIKSKMLILFKTELNKLFTLFIGTSVQEQ